MNRKLLDPKKESALPECIEEFFDYGTAVCCAFNPSGTLLATGTDNGYVGIWDFETRGLARVLPDDSTPEECVISSVCWSHNGRYVLAAQSDKRLVLWEVLSARQVHEVMLPAAPSRASLSATKPFVAVASLTSGPPVVVEFGGDTPRVTPVDTHINLKAVINGSSTYKQRGTGDQAGPAAVLSPSGREVYVAQQQCGRGFLVVRDVASSQLLDVYKLPSPVTSMCLSRRGDLLVLCCADKMLRLAEVRARHPDTQPISTAEAEEALNKLGPDALGSLILGEGRSLISLCPASYVKAVEKGAWLKGVISHDGVHLCGALMSSSNQQLHIWDRKRDKLKCILEGPPGSGIKDLDWHPSRPLLVTVAAKDGKVYIWAPIYAEYWSAFAPDFKELKENEEYVEAEDEFDINKHSQPVFDGPDPEADYVIDIVTREPAPPRSDVEDDDSEEPLLWLPAEPDGPEDKEATEQQQESGDASDEEDDAGPEASGRAATGPADSDGGGLDQPRERKRRVRFEQVDLDNDAEFEELLRRQEEASRQQQATKAGPKHVRRGRPPLPKPPRDPEGHLGAPAAVRPPGSRPPPTVSGGPGGRLNPPDTNFAYGLHTEGLVQPSGGSRSLYEHQLHLQRLHMEQQDQAAAAAAAAAQQQQH